MRTKIIKDPTYNVYAKGGNVETSKNSLDKEDLKNLTAEKDIFDIKFDALSNVSSKILEDYANEKQPGQSLGDWLDTKDDDYFKRIELSNGGKVIDFVKFKKSKSPKVKELDLAAAFDHAKTISSLTDDERDLVNRLLKMSLGKGGTDE